MDDEIPSSFFLSHGEGYVGTILGRGPWDLGSAHGGPVAALIGREVERFDPDPELATVRLTIELLRPVPLAFITVETTMLRPGKRVRLIGASIFHEGVEVARAVVLRIRRVPENAPESTPEVGLPFIPPEECDIADSLVEGRVGIMNALEVRSATGSAIVAGPATYWFRLHKPLVDDEPITALSRTLVAADFGNGISSVVSIDSHVFVNPELTVHLHRLPEGDWVANQAQTWLHPGGASVAEALLTDRTGPIGRAMQSLYIDSR